MKPGNFGKQPWKKTDGRGLKYWITKDETECDMVRLFNISAFPTKILIDPNGIVVSRMVGGMVDAGKILEEIVSKNK